MKYTKAPNSVALFLLVSSIIPEFCEPNMLVITKELPYGRGEIDYPSLEAPKRTAHIKPVSEFGRFRKNSKVDFRQKQPIFWESAVPVDLENKEFICKPGNAVSLNMSQNESHTDYLCENAVGYFIENENSTSNETVMVIDLKDGDDEVYFGDHDLPTIFKVGNNGHKIFEFGQLYNEFQLDSNCDGNLTANLIGEGLAISFIVISGNCSRGKEINLKIMPEICMLTIGSNVNITFTGIRVILFEGLTVKIDPPEMWSLTLLHHKDGWNLGSSEATFCGSENLSWEDRIICTTLWQAFYGWITLTSTLITAGIVTFLTWIFVKSKRISNSTMAYEMVAKAE